VAVLRGCGLAYRMHLPQMTPTPRQRSQQGAVMISLLRSLKQEQKRHPGPPRPQHHSQTRLGDQALSRMPTPVGSQSRLRCPRPCSAGRICGPGRGTSAAPLGTSTGSSSGQSAEGTTLGRRAGQKLCLWLTHPRRRRGQRCPCGSYPWLCGTRQGLQTLVQVGAALASGPAGQLALAADQLLGRQRTEADVHGAACLHAWLPRRMRLLQSCKAGPWRRRGPAAGHASSKLFGLAEGNVCGPTCGTGSSGGQTWPQPHAWPNPREFVFVCPRPAACKCSPQCATNPDP